MLKFILIAVVIDIILDLGLLYALKRGVSFAFHIGETPMKRKLREYENS